MKNKLMILTSLLGIFLFILGNSIGTHAEAKAQNGSVACIIQPQEAVEDGAKWKLKNGPDTLSPDKSWKESGEVIENVESGIYKIKFKKAGTWIKPYNQYIEVTEDAETKLQALYVQKIGSVTCTIEPQEAIEDGAKWKLINGPDADSPDKSWKESGEVIDEVERGVYKIKFNRVSGFKKPKTAYISVTEGENSIVGVYVNISSLGSVSCTIEPEEARKEGAKWKLRNGPDTISPNKTWKKSDRVVKGVESGIYKIKLKKLNGWIKPSNQYIKVTAGEKMSVKVLYVPRKGSVCCTIEPQQAIEDGAKWKLKSTDNSARLDESWKDSGDVIDNVESGQYKIQFKAVDGCEKPDDMSIQVEPDELSSVTSNYFCDEPMGDSDTGDCALGSADLPKTGQTVKHADNDDGDLEMGAQWPIYPQLRFTDNGDGTITDNLTGLMWQQSPSSDEMSWEEALYYANNLDLGDYIDWRLPNRKELRSLIHYGMYNTTKWLQAKGFENVQSNYWTSTTNAKDISLAWDVDLEFGFVHYSDKSMLWSYNYTWAVRTDENAGGVISLVKTGQSTSYAVGDDGGLQIGLEWPEPRFADNNDGTITDNVTGLMWQQAPCDITYSWDSALQYAEYSNLGGYDDWRLPNLNEIESLIDAEEYNPALPIDHLFVSVQDAFLVDDNDDNKDSLSISCWTSTTLADDNDNAWVVDIKYGGIICVEKSDKCYIWPVRCGDK